MEEDNKPLTLGQLKEFTKEVLLPANLEQLKKHTSEAILPATQKQLVDYTTDILLPAFELTLNNKFKENNGLMNDKFKENNSLLDIKLNALVDKLVTKEEFNSFKSKIYTDIDSLIEKVNKLIAENEVRNIQEKRQKEFFAILIKSLKDKNILSEDQLTQIARLDML